MLVALAALLIRGAAVAALADGLAADPDGYRQLAECLLRTGTFGNLAESAGTGDRSQTPVARPTAYRPPLYPLLLAAVGFFAGLSPPVIGGLNVALGAASTVLVFHAARAWRLGRGAWLAAALFACDPILLNQSALVMTETLAALLAIAGWLCLSRLAERPSFSRAIAAGAVLGAAMLCRPTFLIWLLLATAVLVPLIRPRSCGTKLAACLLLGSVVILLPWTARNFIRFGQPIATTTHGGYTLWLANNDEYFSYLRNPNAGEVWSSARLDQAYLEVRLRFGDDEVAADRWAYEQAKATMRRQPRTFAYACFDRELNLWRLMPHRLQTDETTPRRLMRYATGVWYSGVFALALLGLWRLRERLLRSPWLWGLLLCLAFTAAHSVYWSNMRMRGPLTAVVCLLAAASRSRLVKAAVDEAQPQPRPSDRLRPGIMR